jgi:predicted RNA-binding protein with PUA-like domain
LISALNLSDLSARANNLAYNSICFRSALLHAFRMPKQFWLVKSEPEAYSWANLLKDGSTSWTGVRNFQARNNLRAMKKGDAVFFYHSVSDKQVVGVATVAKEAYPDSTAEEGDWSTVDLKPLKALKQPISLDQMKADPILKEMKLIRQSRLSVTPVTENQAQRLLEIGSTSL